MVDPAAAPAPDPMIRVHDATEHNLRHVELAVPRDQVVAFTGVSGSGKSSLAFATIYAEAQRRYLESVAPYARRLIEQAGAPRVGSISGLPPAVALRQQYAAGSARSSVGTVSRVSNVLRMLYSRAGTYPAGAEPVDSDWFSPNTAVGACPTCHGLGRRYRVEEDRLVGDPGLSIREGAVAAWPGAWQGKNYRDILGELGIDIDAPFHTLPAERRHWLLTTEEQPVVTVHPVREAHRITRPYQGTYTSPRSWVLHTYATTKSASLRAKAASFLTEEPCPTCEGRRLNPFALSVTVAGVDIARATALPLAELAELLRRARVHPDTEALSPERRQAADALIGNLEEHLKTLIELGLGYLGTDRATSTLSAGEFQRLHLATQLGSGLFGVLYVLDEPSAGLHPADTELLLAALRRLRAAGNSVFVVEHNPRVISDADWIVDLGPGAGKHGGRVLYSGPLGGRGGGPDSGRDSGPEAGLRGVASSATARYLFGDAPCVSPAAVREPSSWLTLYDVTRHNLDRVTVRFPLGTLTAVTGVSGSGKSTLVGQVLAATVRDHLGTPAASDGDTSDAEDETAGLDDDRIVAVPEAEGLDGVHRLVQVDQKPIGRTPRSNLATYTGLFDAVRKLFAAQPLAKERGYTASRFSFNLPDGRCPNCQGEGVVSVELLFLPTESAPCPVCDGARYNPETLQVLVDGKSVADVLALSVEDALGFLEQIPAAHRVLSLLDDIGLGYLTLGQSATTLSGGEAQRIKLVSELHRARRGHTLYLLDEPTSGLHPADADLLLARLRDLVDQGSTVVIVEHDMRVAASADWLLDLGPGAGAEGGRVVAEGTPAEVSGGGSGRTAQFLAPHVSQRAFQRG